MGSTQSMFDETSTEVPDGTIDPEDMISTSSTFMMDIVSMMVNTVISPISFIFSYLASIFISVATFDFSTYDVFHLQPILFSCFNYISMIVAISLIFASLGISMGFRDMYIEILLKIFEVCLSSLSFLFL